MDVRRRITQLVLAGILALAVVEGYWPFAWDPPHPVANDVRRAAGGALAFGDHNAARTAATPAWLATVRRSERIEVDLVARPELPQRYDAPSIMMLASDEFHTDFALGQEGADLLLWLRRVGTESDADPPFVIANAFVRGRWTDVRLTVRDGVLWVTVDGVMRLRQTLRPGSLHAWAGGLLVLGDEVYGGRGWQGEIRRAAVRTDAGSVDYVRPGALEVPRRYFYLPDHVSPFPPATRVEWLALVLHFVSFVPVGFLLVGVRRRPGRVRNAVLRAAAIALGIAVVLAAGKLLFQNRHLAVADIVVQLAGALLGAYFAAHLLIPRTTETTTTRLTDLRDRLLGLSARRRTDRVGTVAGSE